MTSTYFIFRCGTKELILGAPSRDDDAGVQRDTILQHDQTQKNVAITLAIHQQSSSTATKIDRTVGNVDICILFYFYV
jgi:hypothetical protein